VNIKNLKHAETEFLQRFPGGFQHEDMVAIGKKHKMAKMIDLSQSLFSRDKFARPHTIVDNIVTVISRSSMVSMFEKPKFKSFANALDPMEKELLCHGLEERLYGNEEQGFEIMLELLQTRKMAKWTLMTICSAYFDPQNAVFVKPTTAKGIIRYLELTNLDYKPLPSWGFYQEFRNQITELKSHVDPSLSPTNAAFTGFLMMSI
jgi:hypothetical protein